jgi:regulator of replication initiation timing
MKKITPKQRSMANISMHEGDLHNKLSIIQQQLDNLSKNFGKILTEHRSIKFDFNNYKSRNQQVKHTNQPITTNKSSTSKGIVTENNNGKRIRAETSSDSEFDASDLEKRIASQDSLLESMAEALNKTLQAVNDLKQTQENIYTQGRNFGIEGGNFEAEDDEDFE